MVPQYRHARKRPSRGRQTRSAKNARLVWQVPALVYEGEKGIVPEKVDEVRYFPVNGFMICLEGKSRRDAPSPAESRAECTRGAADDRAHRRQPGGWHPLRLPEHSP